MFRFFGRRRSKDNVKERLKLVLSYDRAKLTPGKMEELKTELLGVIGKYFPSTEQEYDVRFEQHGERMVLLANLPMAASAGQAGDRGSNDSATATAPSSTGQASGNQQKQTGKQSGSVGGGSKGQSGSGAKSRKKSGGKR